MSESIGADRSQPVLESTAESKVLEVQGKKTRRVVAIMHGIRDEGRWMTPLKQLIEKETGAEVAPLSPDRIALTWFLVGRRYLGYVKRYRDDVARLLSNYHEVDIVFIAHSYGTWCLADVIENWGYHSGVMPVALILCGSILPQNYRWGDRWRQVFQRGRRQGELPWVWNDIGGRDPFPLLARLVSKSYGDAGGSRFTEPTPGLVVNRIHAGLDHGGFFIKEEGGSKVLNEDFVRKFWLPIIRGEDAPRYYDDNEATAPVIQRLRYWVKTALEIALWFAGLQIFGWCLITLGNSQSVQTPGRILVVLGAAIPILWLWNGVRENPSPKKAPFICSLAALFSILIFLAGIAWIAAPLFPGPNIAVSPTPLPTPTVAQEWTWIDPQPSHIPESLQVIRDDIAGLRDDLLLPPAKKHLYQLRIQHHYAKSATAVDHFVFASPTYALAQAPTKFSVRDGIDAVIGIYVLDQDHKPSLISRIDNVERNIQIDKANIDAKTVSFVIMVFPLSKDANDILQINIRLLKPFNTVVDIN